MSARNQQIRGVAENLLQSPSIQYQTMASTSPGLDMSHSQSIPSIHTDYIVSEDLLAGQRLDGRMSSVRRFFCLFVTFDLLFTGLMWLICVMLTGEDIQTAFDKQVYHYNVHTSLFDIVLAALCRFVVLLLFYAFLYINHWCVISISTTLTCAFLIAKVFVYTWPESQQPAFEVLLVLTSFVISWGEAWFLDFRVLPQEHHATRFLISNSTETERTPLVRNYVQGLPSTYTESVGNFYSPLQSPEGSLNRVNIASRRQFHSHIRLAPEEENAYKEVGEENLHEAWQLVNNPEWRFEKENAENDRVFVLAIPKTRKIFKITCVLEISPKSLLEELFYKVDCVAQWNPTVIESYKVHAVNEYTDVTYQISADGASGMVKSRDFVTLRHWGLIDDCFVIAFKATEHPAKPNIDKYIRGENGIGCFVMRPVASNPNICEFQWMLNTNLKGWIPTLVLDGAFVNLMFDYIKHLRTHILKLQEAGRLNDCLTS